MDLVVIVVMVVVVVVVMAVNTVVDHLDELFFFEKQLLLDGQFCKPFSVAHVKKLQADLWKSFELV